MSTKFLFLKPFYCVLFGICLFEALHSVYGYDCVKRPKIRFPLCQDRNEARKGHTMCLGGIHQHHMNDTVRNELTKIHNTARTSVSPPAANMIKMEHNNLLEKEAQIWAEQCKLKHDRDDLRLLADRFSVGQNIAITGPTLNWTEVFEKWTNEKSAYKYGGSNSFSAVRNYAQIIYAETYLFGCGVSKCGAQYLYVCNYAPSMNVTELSTPYVTSSGSWCDSCKAHCDNVTSKLCDCFGKLCLNGGKLNLTTCKCECIKEVNLYDPEYCEIQCNPSGDDPQCGKPPFEKSTCGNNSLTSFHCPWLCDMCPYADANYTESSVLLPWERGLPVCTTSTASTSTTVPVTTSRAAIVSRASTARASTKTNTVASAPRHKKSSSARVKVDWHNLMLFIGTAALTFF